MRSFTSVDSGSFLAKTRSSFLSTEQFLECDRRDDWRETACCSWTFLQIHLLLTLSVCVHGPAYALNISLIVVFCSLFSYQVCSSTTYDFRHFRRVCVERVSSKWKSNFKDGCGYFLKEEVEFGVRLVESGGAVLCCVWGHQSWVSVVIIRGCDSWPSRIARCWMLQRARCNHLKLTA